MARISAGLILAGCRRDTAGVGHKALTVLCCAAMICNPSVMTSAMPKPKAGTRTGSAAAATPSARSSPVRPCPRETVPRRRPAHLVRGHHHFRARLEDTWRVDDWLS